MHISGLDAWSYLKLETEALITAAQDQALHTNAYDTNVLHCSDDPLCCLCHSLDETVYHILSLYPFLTPTGYLQWQNFVAALIHKQICEFYGIYTCEKPKPWLYNPQPVVSSNQVKILWDVDIRMDQIISAYRPDIVVHDSLECSAILSHDSLECFAILIDVAIPADVNIFDKEQEKILKYADLCLELQKIWNLRCIKFISMVIGALGSFTPNLLKNLVVLSGVRKIGPLLTATLLGSAYLMRRSLSIPEFG